jgi:hypothetical protein
MITILSNREDILKEIVRRFNKITTVNGFPYNLVGVWRNPGNETINAFPTITIFEDEDEIVEQKRAIKNAKAIQNKRSFELVCEFWLNPDYEYTSSKEAVEFYNYGRQVLFTTDNNEIDFNLSNIGQCLDLKELKTSRIMRPRFNSDEDVIGMAVLLQVTYIDRLNQ